MLEDIKFTKKKKNQNQMNIWLWTSLSHSPVHCFNIKAFISSKINQRQPISTKP